MRYGGWSNWETQKFTARMAQDDNVDNMWTKTLPDALMYDAESKSHLIALMKEQLDDYISNVKKSVRGASPWILHAVMFEGLDNINTQEIAEFIVNDVREGDYEEE